MSEFDVTTRDLLLLAFAELGSYGIAAEESVDVGAEQARRELSERLRRLHPYGLGSYVFWLRADEACFGADGELRGALPLHISGAEVDRAVRASLAGYALDVEAGNGLLLVSVPAAGAARAA